jgi:hypothetical protein
VAFKLNMSDKEAESKEFEFPPSGEYLVRIADISLEEVKKAGDNFGNPYWKFKLVIEEVFASNAEQYVGQTIPTTVMLYKGALYSIKQLCEALHPEYIVGKEINLPSLENGAPDPDPWLGQLVKIKGVKFAENTKRKDGSTREYAEFQIRYRPVKSDKKENTGGLPIPS